MKTIYSAIMAVALVLTITFVGSSIGYAQQTTMGKIGDTVENTTKTVAKKTTSGAKAVYRGGKRVGYTVGSKTWNGSKWVASKSWKGGKWIAVKTVNGTKWVYRKAKSPFVTPKRNM
ncbi:MAG: hypothetical protein WBC19_09290 [Pyrinomonadaceae bacterium]